MLTKVDSSNQAHWKQRFRAPTIFYATIAAHAPAHGLVWTNQSGALQFHAWDIATGSLRQITHTPGGQNTFLNLSPDGKWLYFLKDDHGNELGHYVRMPYEGGEAVDITPDMPPYSSWNFSISRGGTRLGYTSADAQGFHAYVVDINSKGELGSPRVIYQSASLSSGPFFSADGSVAVMMSSERTGRNEYALLAFDASNGQKLNELWNGDGNSIAFQKASPLPGDARILATSNSSGMEHLLIWNPRTGERNDLPVQDIPGAQWGHDWSKDGERILFSSLDQAVQQVYLLHISSGQVRKLETQAGEYDPHFTPDGEMIYANWGDAAHPNCLVELDSSGKRTRTLLQAAEVPEGKSFQSVTFPGAKGEPIQGWLCVPQGNGPFPTILETHGGPTAVQGSGFNPTAQAWVDLGFAFLTINYHGSVTFGREFEKSIWGRLGDVEVDDMAGAQAWLVKSGIADPNTIFLTGWSYGGYLTLLGLGKRPDLWAGGLAGIAIADWALMWEDSADTLRMYQEALLGGTPREIPERYALSSPIHYAEAIRAPLLIIQGRNDTRTPARPIQVFEARMRELGKEIMVHWYDSGHAGSFADVELGISHQQLMMVFALKHIR